MNIEKCFELIETLMIDNVILKKKIEELETSVDNLNKRLSIAETHNMVYGETNTPIIPTDFVVQRFDFDNKSDNTVD